MHYLVLVLTADNATLGIAKRVERIHVHAGLLLAARSLHTFARSVESRRATALVFPRFLQRLSLRPCEPQIDFHARLKIYFISHLLRMMYTNYPSKLFVVFGFEFSAILAGNKG